MSPELYFIYDSHCPWSYGCTELVNVIAKAYPEMIIHTWHSAHYDGSDCPGLLQVKEVAKQSAVKFDPEHIRFADSPKNSLMVANLMAWLQRKQPEKVLEVINELQQAHFNEGNPLTCKHDFADLIERLKLSPPNKVFKEELTQDAQYILADIAELQEFMGTTSFPALLLTNDDKAVLLDHSLYLGKPSKIVNAIKKEL